MVRRFSHIVNNLRLVDNEKNKGKGGAVKQGMLEAKGDYRLFMDADNSTTVDQFENMIPYFKEGYDIVIGSRDVKGAELHPAQPFYKRMLGNAGNIFIQVVAVRGIWDTQNGFKAFRNFAAEKIFSQTKIFN